MLSDEQVLESSAYVCYERTMYHYLQRRSGVERFPWLLLDRLFHLTYVPGCNEALQYRGDGFSDLQAAYSEVIWATEDELRSELRSRLHSGWLAHSMIVTERPDGSTYVTSTLVEGIDREHLLLTKTNESMRQYCVPTAVHAFLARLPRSDEGLGSLTFIRFSEEVVAKLSTLNGGSLLRYIYRDLYGYRSHGPDVFRHAELTGPGGTGIAELSAYLVDRLDTDHAALVSDPGLQLMMNKHVANKIAPLVQAWRAAMGGQGLCALEASGDFTFQFDHDLMLVETQLAELSARFVLAVRRPGARSVESYLQSLARLDSALQVVQRDCWCEFQRMTRDWER